MSTPRVKLTAEIDGVELRVLRLDPSERYVVFRRDTMSHDDVLRAFPVELRNSITILDESHAIEREVIAKAVPEPVMVPEPPQPMRIHPDSVEYLARQIADVMQPNAEPSTPPVEPISARRLPPQPIRSNPSR